MLLAADPPVVPFPAKLVNNAFGVNVSVRGPSTPIAPIRISAAWVVAAVVPDDALVLFPVTVLVLSKTLVVASPENSVALKARAAAEGWVMVIVEPPGRGSTLCAARRTVLTPLAVVTSASTV